MVSMDKDKAREKQKGTGEGNSNYPRNEAAKKKKMQEGRKAKTWRRTLQGESWNASTWRGKAWGIQMRLPGSPEGSTAAQPKRGLKETSRKLV